MGDLACSLFETCREDCFFAFKSSGNSAMYISMLISAPTEYQIIALDVFHDMLKYCRGVAVDLMNQVVQGNPSHHTSADIVCGCHRSVCLPTRSDAYGGTNAWNSQSCSLAWNTTLKARTLLWMPPSSVPPLATCAHARSILGHVASNGSHPVSNCWSRLPACKYVFLRTPGRYLDWTFVVLLMTHTRSHTQLPWIVW